MRAAIEAKGRGCTLLSADLAIETQVAGLIDAAGPGLGVLVNNASVFEHGEWHDTDRANWDRHIETNLRAPFLLMQEFARALPGAARGVIVNLLDQRVWSLTPHFIAYSVAKYGLWGATQTMALALAPRIRVNAIGPGPALPSARQSQAQVRCPVCPVAALARNGAHGGGVCHARHSGASLDDRADDRA